MTEATADHLSILILTRNEATNIDALLPRIATMLEQAGVAGELIVVDADSHDGTADAALRHNARVIRQTLPGYANALRQGFGECKGDLIATLDADLSHGPEVLTTLLQAIDGADLVVASRYVQGGSADMPLGRRLLSVLLNRIFGWTLGLPVRDLSSGFRIYRRNQLERLQPRGEHFDVLPEIVALACLRGMRVREIPFHYRVREAGVSKARVLAFMPAYLRTLLRCLRAKFGRAATTG